MSAQSTASQTNKRKYEPIASHGRISRQSSQAEVLAAFGDWLKSEFGVVTPKGGWRFGKNANGAWFRTGHEDSPKGDRISYCIHDDYPWNGMAEDMASRTVVHWKPERSGSFSTEDRARIEARRRQAESERATKLAEAKAEQAKAIAIVRAFFAGQLPEAC